MTKKYTSFLEIDHDLKILRLQREIAKESLKLDLKTTKDHLEPKQMIQAASFDIKRSLIDFALSKGLEWLRRLGRKA